MANVTQIPAPRVELIDPRTGLMSREWFRFFNNLYVLTGGGTTDTSLADLQLAPIYQLTSSDATVANLAPQTVTVAEPQFDLSPRYELGTLASQNADNITFGNLTVTGTATFSAGTANQVQYLNASKVLTGSVNLTFDGTNLGIGVTPNYSLTSYKGGAVANYIQVASGATGAGAGNGLLFGVDASGNSVINAQGAINLYLYVAGVLRVTIDSSGNLTVPAMYGTTVTTPRNVFIDSTGKMGGISSTRASKANIAPLADVSWLYDLKPVSFNYRKRDKDGVYLAEFEREKQYGMIAEDTVPIAPDLCAFDDNGKVVGIHYDRMVAPLLKALQDQASRIDALEKKLGYHSR